MLGFTTLRVVMAWHLKIRISDSNQDRTILCATLCLISVVFDVTLQELQGLTIGDASETTVLPPPNFQI